MSEGWSARIGSYGKTGPQGKIGTWGRSITYIESVVDVLRSDWITQGPKIDEFEKSLCAYTGAEYAVAVFLNHAETWSEFYLNQ